MRSIGLKLIVFTLFFLVEVDIKAQVTQWPKDCDFTKPGCAVGTEGLSRWITVDVDGFEIHLSPDAALSRRADSRVHLMGGAAIIANKRSSTLEVSFPTGSVLVDPGHEVYLEVSSETLQVHAHLTRVKVLDKSSDFDLLPGLKVEKSLAQLPAWWSVPRAYSFEKMLSVRANAGLISGQEDATALAKRWRAAASIASATSQHLVERALASEQLRRQEQQLQSQKVYQEQQKLRALFRKKNYLDQ